MTPPQIAIIHVDSIPASSFEEFQRIVSVDRLNLSVDARPEFGPMVALEWFIPTAVFAYIGKSYFDGFLKEMGKDHYLLLKAGLKSLYGSFLGPKAPKVHIISTVGKTSSKQPFSFLYSIVAEADNGLRFKLLLPTNSTEAEYEATLNAFLKFLERFHANTLDQSVIESFSSAKPIGGTLLLRHNPESDSIEPVDPLADKNKK